MLRVTTQNIKKQLLKLNLTMKCQTLLKMHKPATSPSLYHLSACRAQYKRQAELSFKKAPNICLLRSIIF